MEIYRRMGLSTCARLTLLAVLFCPMPLAAQSWDDLRGLKPGDTVKVQDTSGKEQKGALRAVSANAISIAAGKSEVSIERLRVRRIQVKSAARRWRNVAIGVGIGVAVGLIADQTLGAYIRNESSQSSGARVLTYVAPIGLCAGIAAATSGYRTVYRAR